MDDPRSIPPLRPVAPRPPDQRGQRRPGRDQRRPADEDAPGAQPPADQPSAEVPDDAFVAALDRLRATDAPRTADLALMRLWRGLRAYQDADDGSGVHDAGAPR